jgi:recombinational DNA repair protein (RecF pathway)
VLDALAAGVDVEALARYFEYWLLRIEGVYPPHLACHRCDRRFAGGGERGAWLSPVDGVFTCTACADAIGDRRLGTAVSAGALGYLAAARRHAPRDLSSVTVAASVLSELERLHRALMARHLEREVKSVRVLRDLRRLS